MLKKWKKKTAEENWRCSFKIGYVFLVMCGKVEYKTVSGFKSRLLLKCVLNQNFTLIYFQKQKNIHLSFTYGKEYAD